MTPSWTTFIGKLGPDERYERVAVDDLPGKEVRVEACRVCWSKDGGGLHLFLDVQGETKWRVFLSKGHPSFPSVLDGATIVGVRQAEGLLVVTLQA